MRLGLDSREIHLDNSLPSPHIHNRENFQRHPSCLLFPVILLSPAKDFCSYVHVLWPSAIFLPFSPPNACTTHYKFSVPQLQDNLALRLPFCTSSRRMKKAEKARRVHYRNIAGSPAYLQSSAHSLSSPNGCFHFVCCPLVQIYAVVKRGTDTRKVILLGQILWGLGKRGWEPNLGPNLIMGREFVVPLLDQPSTALASIIGAVLCHSPKWGEAIQLSTYYVLLA